ncbi:MAG: DUF1592 domain-containing protein, partial [Planctomycetaceae bacterium]|nr:DUF1592 domain-containing protein [Planctomycetaceae bacterium]
GRDLRRSDVMAKWVHLFDRVERNEMPPEDADQPSAAERAAFLTAAGKSLTTTSTAQASTVLRRLNRVEYENTLNDMLGVRESLAELLPEDGKAHGFDNVGEALDLSAVHLERYMTAAGQAMDAAVRRTPKPDVKRSTHGLADGKNAERIGKLWHQTTDGAVVVFNNGGFPRPEIESFRTPVEGNYRITVRGYAYQTDQPVTVAVWQGVFAPSGSTARATTLVFPPRNGDQPVSREFTVWLKPNARLAFFPQLTVDNAKLRSGGPAKYDGSGLAISSVEIEGPLFDEWPGRGHALLFGELPVREIEPANPQQKKQKWYRPQYEIVSQTPDADARRLLRQFLPIAFRRPVVDADVAPLLELAKSELDSGANFEQAMRTAYSAALCSPDFVYLREPTGTLDDFALASRLSYAVWNTLPDAELRSLATKGELSRPEVLRAQTERLLSDSRSSRFVTTFTGQWLNLRDIDFTVPDKQLYPEYDDALRDAMVAETEGFFAEVLRNNQSVLDFIDSDWTMLNERLASHYRIGGVEGHELRRVSLKPEDHRGGVLTHASVLKVSANGTTTSPVIRGIFVLERILGMEPPAPPPGVPGVEPDIRGATTLREQLEKHREIQSCNNCHKAIDPPGFALENYDVMGGWRDNYRSLNTDFPTPSAELRGSIRNVRWRIGPQVDASGGTPDGREFDGLDDYKQILLQQPKVFTRALIEKLAVYMTGRAMGFADRPELDRITESVASQGYGFRHLLHEIVQSEVFRQK